MSKLTDIKYRIDQMDGGEFQNLCDEYLTCRGYRAQYPFGKVLSTNHCQLTLTLAIRDYVLYFVQLRIAKVNVN